MMEENNKNVKPFCKDYWGNFQQNFKNTELLKRVLNDTTPNGDPVFIRMQYYARRFFYIPKRGEILAKVLAGKFGAIDKKGEKGVYVELLLETSKSYDINKELFRQLEKDKKIIENKLGFSLEWKKGTETERSRIFVHNDNFNPRDETSWEKQHEWVVKTITKFERVFTPLL